MPAEPKLDIEAILQTLDAHGVECIVVGGVCAILHGAPVATFDLEVVHARNAANVRGRRKVTCPRAATSFS